ncbi:MAG: FAS1-like dehydratase domain-containing protein [Acidimicrobiales bacterium]
MNDTEQIDEDLGSLIGRPAGKSRVVLERGPVAYFAIGVCDKSPVYQDPRAAEAAGLPAIPVPPTFSFAWDTWGKFVEMQPDDVPQESAIGEVVGSLMSKGGVILHGEQEFIYHKPVFVGDVLLGEGKVVDAYRKESKGHVMTFVIAEMVWRDDETGELAVTSRTNIIHRQ